MTIKLDIRKAFDTFLLNALRALGFCETFVKWVHVILLSARLSIKVNDSPHGFFGCGRNVRQVDPLSPMLFCIAEDVLSRGIIRLVSRGSLHTISSPRGHRAAFHMFYADDMIIFCKVAIRGLKSLLKLLEDYEEASSKIVSRDYVVFCLVGTSM